AVGMGYRFNEQAAAKAGTAFSDGDVSWNVGLQCARAPCVQQHYRRRRRRR
ncbi:YadA-like family protein, partial [Escherichia coli]|nr:YadA-like family protein [Escherichia coli]